MYNLFPQLGYFSASGLSGVGGSAEIQKTGCPHRKLKSDYKIQLFLSELQLIEYIHIFAWPASPGIFNLRIPLICPLKFFNGDNYGVPQKSSGVCFNNFHVSKPN